MGLRKFRRKIIPDYAVIPFFLCLIGQLVTFYGTRAVNLLVHGSIEGYLDLTTWIDRQIPLVPAWTVYYFLCYIFWAVNYVLVSRESREMSNRLLVADMIGKIICTTIFIVMPTSVRRPDVPEGEFLLKMLYDIDLPDNLFPSMHCSVSWFAARYAGKCSSVPKWYKWLSFLFAFMVFACVLFTKQHVFVDVIAGVAVAETGILIADRTRLPKLYERLDLTDKLTGGKN